jgi:O-glycosyl hydrolase
MKKLSLILVLFSAHLMYAQDNAVLTVTIDKGQVYQGIKGFGASDAWRTQFVGAHWPEEKRNHIADLLFSLQDDKDGNPKGIGLSAWRFYLGAGSMEQGDSSNIRNVWRRSESFLDEDGTYDWTKYKGQRWFLQAAKQRGVNQFQIFTISPPVFYTKNGYAYSTEKDLSFNLKEDKYGDYAKFLVDVIAHFKLEEGIHFDYVSPFNEPQWDWGKGSQEGTPASNEELYLYLKHVSDSLHANDLQTKIIAGEAGDYRIPLSSGRR